MKNIKRKEVLIIFLFYLFFSFLYRIVLWFNIGSYAKEGFWGWINLRDYWYMAGMQYAFYFLSSICIWFLVVKLLKNKSSSLQMVVVFLLVPITVYFVREWRYEFLDSIGIFHLIGTGSVWDWYIPTLFMWVQFGVFFAYKYFIDNQKKIKLEGELKQIALKSELSALKAQLNPHFLYNVFNTISASVPAENEKTRSLIAELSDLFRYQLKASQVEKVALKEELEFVKKYLQLEKERFEDRLKISFIVDDAILQEKVPPMLLQPLVENSIKHGIASLIEGGEISIKIQKKEEKLIFEIADTGIGIKDKNAVFEKGIGLTNTKLRLEKMYNSVLTLEDNLPKGLKISFEI
jgi:signal transduction histidine kinase